MDDLQLEVALIRRKNNQEKPPEFVFGSKFKNLKLRPLYLDLKEGILKRAVPISWNEGVPYES